MTHKYDFFNEKYLYSTLQTLKNTFLYSSDL